MPPASRRPSTSFARQIDQADAQIKLLDEQLARIKLRSSIAGLVVSGDLSQMIGASVQRGQLLFEVAPLNSYRVILSVDEREIGRVEPGQTGDLVVSALPNETLSFKVDKITPIADAQSGRNVFRVEGLLYRQSAAFAARHGRRRQDRNRPSQSGLDLAASADRLAADLVLALAALRSDGNVAFQ